jgi:hypothetical protein
MGQDYDKAWTDVEIREGKLKRRFKVDYVVGCDKATSAVKRSLVGRNDRDRRLSTVYCPEWDSPLPPLSSS